MNGPVQPETRAFKRGDILSGEGAQIGALGILLQGRLEIRLSPAFTGRDPVPPDSGGTYRLFDIDRNVFLGASSLAAESPCGCQCVAVEDGSLIAYPVADIGQFWSLLQNQKDYGTFVIQSLGIMIQKMHGALSGLWERTERLRIQTANLALFFWVLRQANDCTHAPSLPWFREALEQYGHLREAGAPPAPLFNPDFIREDHDAPDPAEETLYRAPLPPDPIGYAIRLNTIPLEARKLFFGADAHVMQRHVNEAAECLNELFMRGRDLLARYAAMMHRLYADGEESLFTAWLKMAREMALAGQNPSSAAAAIDTVIQILDETLRESEQTYGHPAPVDLTYIRHARNQLNAFLEGSADEEDGTPLHAAMHALPEELKDSTAKLLSYAGLPQPQTDAFLIALSAFRGLKDRFSQTPEAREIRNAMTDHFKTLYGSVFRRALQAHDGSRLVGMFLQFGFADEWLLDPEQTLTLYRLAGKDALRAASAAAPTTGSPAASTAPVQRADSGHANMPKAEESEAVHAVYTLREWLERMHELKEEPSRNDFDQDYQDVFRELKKQGKATDRDKAAYDADAGARLEFELGIQIGINQRACHGKGGIFYPILHRAMITRNPDTAAVTPEKVRAALERIVAVDYGAFYREVHFVDPRKVIEKERIMKCAPPDVILLPTFGSRGMMWQEIAGRGRGTSARFLLPAMTDEDLDTMLLRLVGNFRWEMCRTLMGTAWNDVTLHSLTSEYSDYIQFYKSNASLSDEAKDGIRSQIERFRGNTRDIFTSDYEVWIRNESKGNQRLNRVVREIMFRWCPFARDIRQQLEKHPTHASAIRAFHARQAKEAHSLESRYNRYRGTTGRLDPDLEANLRFYRDL